MERSRWPVPGTRSLTDAERDEYYGLVVEVLGEDGAVVGPYTHRGLHGDGRFWSHSLPGSSLRLELHYAGSDTGRALAAARFVVKNVGHLDIALPTGPDAAARVSNLCGYNVDCIEDAAAAQGQMPPAVQVARDGMRVATYDETPIARHMTGDTIDIAVTVGHGGGTARVWTCDLTHGYITINADYRS